MPNEKTIELLMRVKDINIKSLQTGDKQGWLRLETLRPEDVEKISELSGITTVKISITPSDKM